MNDTDQSRAPIAADTGEEPLDPPTRGEIASSIVAVCTVLLKYLPVAGNNTTKVRCAARYADTFFDGNDLNRMQEEMRARPGLVVAIDEQNIENAVKEITPPPTHTAIATPEATAALITCIRDLSTRMSDEDMGAIWFELSTWCLLVK